MLYDYFSIVHKTLYGVCMWKSSVALFKLFIVFIILT